MQSGSTENGISRKIIGAAIEVHKTFGPGLLESTYETSLAREPDPRGTSYQRQHALPLIYKEANCDTGYRMDLLVEKKLIVEIKAVECLGDNHVAQLLTHLKLTGCRLGLLINFNVGKLRDGIGRVVIRLDE